MAEQMSDRPPMARSGILNLPIRDKSVLYASYMPFVRDGGLFVATAKNYRLGDEVFILLQLMDDPDKMPVTGRIIWVTPKGAQGNRAQGVGIQFINGTGEIAKKRIEEQLAGSLKSDRITHTL